MIQAFTIFCLSFVIWFAWRMHNVFRVVKRNQRRKQRRLINQIKVKGVKQ